jgi:hypothetical protein
MGHSVCVGLVKTVEVKFVVGVAGEEEPPEGEEEDPKPALMGRGGGLWQAGVLRQLRPAVRDIWRRGRVGREKSWWWVRIKCSERYCQREAA